MEEVSINQKINVDIEKSLVVVINRRERTSIITFYLLQSGGKYLLQSGGKCVKEKGGEMCKRKWGILQI